MKYRTIGAFAILVALSADARAQDCQTSPAEVPRGRSRRQVRPLTRPRGGAADLHRREIHAPQRPVLYGKRCDGSSSPMARTARCHRNSTQSFEDGITQPHRARRYYKAIQRSIFTAGIHVSASSWRPDVRSIKSSATIDSTSTHRPDRRPKSDSYISARSASATRSSSWRRETSTSCGPYTTFRLGQLLLLPRGLRAAGSDLSPHAQLRIVRDPLGELEVMSAVAAVRSGQRDSGVPVGRQDSRSPTSWGGRRDVGLHRPNLRPFPSASPVSTVASRCRPSQRAGFGSGEDVRQWSAVSAMVPVIPIKTIEDRSTR